MAKSYYIKKTGDAQAMGDTRGLITSAGMVVPDYANITENKFASAAAADQSWTADKDGFVQLDGALSNSVAANKVYVIGFVNDVAVYQNGEYTAGAGQTMNTTGFAQVAKGDVVRLQLIASGGTVNPQVSTCRFIPPKVIQTIPPMIAGHGALVSGGAFQFDADGNGYTENYFESEIQVGWYTRADGKRKPVYRQYFTGQLSIAASTTDDRELIPETSGIVEQFLGATGTAQIGASSRMMDINSSRGDGGNYDYYFAVNQNSSGLSLMSWCKYTRVSTANTYRVRASYIKATDAWQ